MKSGFLSQMEKKIFLSLTLSEEDYYIQTLGIYLLQHETVNYLGQLGLVT